MRRHAGLFICLIHLCSPDMSHGRGQVQLGIFEEYVTFEMILDEEWAVKVNVCYESCRGLERSPLRWWFRVVS